MPRACFYLEVIGDNPTCQVAQHEVKGVPTGVEKHLEEVIDGHLLYQVESVLTKDAMVDVVAIVCVSHTLQPELDRSLHRHEEREEDPPIRQDIAESVDEEEENGNQLGCHRSPDEILQDNLGATMSQRAMPEKQVSKPI